MKKIRWVTWWPAPYWTARWNCLSKYPNVDLEVLFLNSASSLQEWSEDKSSWKFKYAFCGRRASRSGYFKVKLEFPRPGPLLKGGFDCLVMPYSSISCLAAAALCVFMRGKYVLFAPNTLWEKRVKSRVRGFIKLLAYKGAAGIFATGAAQKDYALRCGARPNDIYVIGNPSTRFSTFASRREGKRSDYKRKFGWNRETVVLSVGRLSPEKGIDTLMRAISTISGLDLHIVLAGSGPEKDNLSALADKLKLRVTFTGFMRDEKLADLYSAADIFALPSLSEAWGLVVNEAMEFSLPLVLSDHVGCVPELLSEGKNGYSFPAGQEAELAECIRLLAENDSLRAEMGRLSREIVSAHSIENWADAVCEACEKIIRKGRGSHARAAE